MSWHTRLTTLLPLLALGAFLFGITGGVALAHTRVPARESTRVAAIRPMVSCTTDCDTNDYWNEDNHGSSIGLTGPISLIVGVAYKFYTVLSPKTTFDLVPYIGYETGQGYCTNDAIRGFFFYRLLNQSGVVLQSGCFDASSYGGDIIIMQMNWYVSNGGGIQFYINDFTTGAHFCNPCSYSNGRTNNEWSQVSYHSDTSGTWTGTAVTTGHLTTPDYQNASGNWVEQPNGGNFNDFDDPTQGYWHQAPPNLAADAFWCDQASSSSCVL